MAGDVGQDRPDAAHPTVAIAVVVTDPNGGYGGTVAAPIAARVLRDILPNPR